MILGPPPGAARILVVDDTPANVQLLIRMLSGRGYVMQAVSGGEEALQAVHDSPPDLILLDINMPHMSGFEVCERLKADPDLAAIPVIFISALHETTDKVRAFLVGGVDYVTKPFQLDEVYARVETHIKLRQLQRQQAEHNQQLERLVAQRTTELAAAYTRVQELSSVKGDFLAMISHEMRTPAHGLLGLGELLIRLCPPSDTLTRYVGLFQLGTDRLVGLLNDVSLISEADAIAHSARVASRLADVMDQVCSTLPDLRITLDATDALRTVAVDGTAELLVRALKTVVQMAAAFSAHTREVHLVAQARERGVCLRVEVSRLSLSTQQAETFFAIGSSARAVSDAETLGLAPVVAHQILRAMGGDLKLRKEAGDSGSLEVTLRCAASAEGLAEDQAGACAQAIAQAC